MRSERVASSGNPDVPAFSDRPGGGTGAAGGLSRTGAGVGVGGASAAGEAFPTSDSPSGAASDLGFEWRRSIG